MVDPSNRFVYTANSNSHDISAFALDATTGALTPIAGSPFAEGGDPEWLVVEATGQFLYVADPLFEKVKGYRINATTGALTALAPTTMTGNNVNGMATTPSGKFLYAATALEGSGPGVSRIYGFAIDATTGALTAVAGSPWLVGSNKLTMGLAVDPTGRFLYAANTTSNDIVGYSIDGNTGTLTPLASSPFAGGSGPERLAIAPTGTLLYATNGNSNTISGYALNTNTGALTPLPGSPTPTGLLPRGLVIDPSGQLLYVANVAGDTVSAFSLNSTSGALAPLGSPASTGSAPFSLAGTRRGASVVPAVALLSIATGVTAPVAITNAHDGSGRLFITLQDGRVMIHNGCQLLSTPFLDIRSVVLSGGEQGLLSIAFHPAFPATPYFYVYYTRKPDGAIVIARYRVSTGNANVADPASAAVLIVIPHPDFTNHNGGQVQFGPDGYLYFATGDGGSGNDPSCNAQSNASRLGKMMRIDVNQNFNTPPFYGIPPTNPFVGPGDPPDEVWAKGLRNPYRFSFDRVLGDLLIGGRRPGRARGSGPPASGPGRTELRLEGGGRHPLHQQHRRVRRGSPRLQLSRVHIAHPRLRPHRRPLLDHRRLSLSRHADPRPRRRLRVRGLLHGGDVRRAAIGRCLDGQPAPGCALQRQRLRRRRKGRDLRRELQRQRDPSDRERGPHRRPRH